MVSMRGSSLMPLLAYKLNETPSKNSSSKNKRSHFCVINASVDGHGHEVVGVDEVLDVLVDHAHVTAIIKTIHNFLLTVVGDSLFVN
jgi:hypothetical protein